MTAGAPESAATAAKPASPAVKATLVAIPPEASAGEAFRISLESCLEHLAANEPLFLRDRHADNLHQTRVSWRRARAAFSLFRALVRTDEAGMDTKVRMREIVLPLGPARDADVLLARAVAEEWPAWSNAPCAAGAGGRMPWPPPCFAPRSGWRSRTT